VAAIEPGLVGAEIIQRLFGVVAFEGKELLFGSGGEEKFGGGFGETGQSLFFEYT
jgi:hypothetical protein